jgi:hypothetical protein
MFAVINPNPLAYIFLIPMARGRVKWLAALTSGDMDL